MIAKQKIRKEDIIDKPKTQQKGIIMCQLISG